jgi:hypothetical protein
MHPQAAAAAAPPPSRWHALPFILVFGCLSVGASLFYTRAFTLAAAFSPFRVSDTGADNGEAAARALVLAMTASASPLAACPVMLTHFTGDSADPADPRRAPLKWWWPWQPADTIDRYSAHLECQERPHFCNDSYARADTRAVLDAIWRHQNPASCASAKFLVLTSEHQAGLGRLRFPLFFPTKMKTWSLISYFVRHFIA